MSREFHQKTSKNLRIIFLLIITGFFLILRGSSAVRANVTQKPLLSIRPDTQAQRMRKSMEPVDGLLKRFPLQMVIPWFTEIVSVSSSGVQSNADFITAKISADGRFVAFSSWATNLFPSDTNSNMDVFVRSLEDNQTYRASVTSSGQSGSETYGYSISADGRYVAFDNSFAMVPNDTNSTWDIFVHDMLTGENVLASVSSDGVQGNQYSSTPSISADGHYVAFISAATNLVEGAVFTHSGLFVHDMIGGETILIGEFPERPVMSADGRFVAYLSYLGTNYRRAYVWDRLTGQTVHVGVGSNGEEANDFINNIAISPEGRFVVFDTMANNLVPGDTSADDVFLRDLQTNTTTRISVPSSGTQGNGQSYSPSISSNGDFIAYTSNSSNLVPGDTNQSPDIFLYNRLTGETNRISWPLREYKEMVYPKTRQFLSMGPKSLTNRGLQI